MMCPCGTQRAYEDCCGLYHQGVPAPDPEALMRSRYSAFVLKKNDYLVATHWKKKKEDYDFSREDDIVWHRLDVLKTTVQKTKATVVFKAFGRDLQGEFCLQEQSEFICDHDLWYYLKGEAKTLALALAKAQGRNEPCACLSGKKFKQCCGR